MDCTECRGTGLRGGDGSTPEHVGRLVNCAGCTGTGKVEAQTPAAPAESDIHTPGGEA